MHLKPSRYNLLVHDDDGSVLAFNAMNCALAKVNKQFLQILQQPDNPLDSEGIELRDNMLKVGYLIEADVDELKQLELRHWKNKFSRKKFIVTILPTLDCNFNCFYCFEKKSSSYMKQDAINALLKFIDSQISEYPALKVIYFGGEPLLAKDTIWEISERLIRLARKHQCNYEFFMVTNGYLIDNEIIGKLNEYHINKLQITLDGDAEKHDCRRATKNGEKTFDRILTNIQLLIAAGITVFCRINVDRTNLDSVRRLLHLFGNLHQTNRIYISFGRILPIAMKLQWEKDICLSETEFSTYIQEFVNILHTYNLKVEDKYPFYPTPKANFCGASQINSCVVFPDGSIHKCWDYIGLPTGTVFEGIGSNATYEQNEAQWILDSPFNDTECRECSVLPLCMGGCPYFRLVHKSKQCLKWKWDIQNVIKEKYHQSCI